MPNYMYFLYIIVGISALAVAAWGHGCDLVAPQQHALFVHHHLATERTFPPPSQGTARAAADRELRSSSMATLRASCQGF